jgi:hypothetical protein
MMWVTWGRSPALAAGSYDYVWVSEGYRDRILGTKVYILIGGAVVPAAKV